MEKRCETCKWFTLPNGLPTGLCTIPFPPVPLWLRENRNVRLVGAYDMGWPTYEVGTRGEKGEP